MAESEKARSGCRKHGRQDCEDCYIEALNPPSQHELIEAARALLDAMYEHGPDGAEIATAADELRAHLPDPVAPEERCPTCGSDDPAKNWCVIYGDDVYIGGWGDEAFVQGSARIALGTVTAYRCPDSTAFHGIEASEGGLDPNEPLEPDATVEVPFGAPVPESPAESVPDSEVRELREALEKLLAVVDAETIERTYAFPNARRLTEAADIARRALAPDPEGGTDG